MSAREKSGFLSRRRFAQGAMLAAAGLPASYRIGANAQSLRPVKFTLPWIVGGSNFWPVVGKKLGYFAARGIDIDIARGFGSSAAALAVANKQFDFGIVFAGPTIVAAARGLPIVALGTIYYDAAMGIIMRADSSIRAPKDFEGKKLGVAPADAVAPFWPAFARTTGIDASKVNLVQVESKVIERTLVDKQVDGITGVGNANIPVMVAMGEPARFMPWSPYGINFYAAQLVTRQEIVDQDPKLCQSIADATLEAVAYTLRNPEASIDALIAEFPEIGLTKGGRENARVAQGLTQVSMASPEAIEHGLGWSDINKYPAMIDLVMEFVTPKDAQRPDPEKLVTNRFAGNTKLSKPEWDQVKRYTADFVKYQG